MDNRRKRKEDDAAKDKVRQRMHGCLDPDNYQYYPVTIKNADFYDVDVEQNVGIYVRVSTNDIKQTTSYELQKIYYEDFVRKHPNWNLVEIYADEGISGTSTAHRVAFNRMIADAKAGVISMIICKNVSRFARNITDCIGVIRTLAELRHPVGVFFESECIFSLKEENSMTLNYLAGIADEESHIRSRGMEASLKMRLDNGIPLTPKLIGYTHDEDGKLIINEEEAPTVKLAFYMYLFGYSTQEIADTFNAQGRQSMLGNVNWTANGIVDILRSERHCGEVLTRKTFTPNFRTHKSIKNRGERAQSLYMNHHEAIIKKDDFVAVQKMLDNAKYGHKHILPQLRVVTEGILKGYVNVHTTWSGFTPDDYMNASLSVFSDDEQAGQTDFAATEAEYEEWKDYEVVRSEFITDWGKCNVLISSAEMSFNTQCVRKFPPDEKVELLVNPVQKTLAVRTSIESNRSEISWSRRSNGRIIPRSVPSTAFGETLYSLFDWIFGTKYQITGSFLQKNNECLLIFEAKDARIRYTEKDAGNKAAESAPNRKRRQVTIYPEEWGSSFGEKFYLHEAMRKTTRDGWNVREQGTVYSTGTPLNLTEHKELETYINNAVSINPTEEKGNHD